MYDSTNLLSNSWKPVINLSTWCTFKRIIEASHLRRWHCYRDIDLRSPNSKIPSPKQKKYEVTFEKFPPIFLNERTTNCKTREKYWKTTNGTRSGSLQVSRTMMELLKLTVLPWNPRRDVNPKGRGPTNPYHPPPPKKKSERSTNKIKIYSRTPPIINELMSYCFRKILKAAAALFLLEVDQKKPRMRHIKS